MDEASSCSTSLGPDGSDEDLKCDYVIANRDGISGEYSSDVINTDYSSRDVITDYCSSSDVINTDYCSSRDVFNADNYVMVDNLEDTSRQDGLVGVSNVSGKSDFFGEYQFHSTNILLFMKMEFPEKPQLFPPPSLSAFSLRHHTCGVPLPYSQPPFSAFLPSFSLQPSAQAFSLSISPQSFPQLFTLAFFQPFRAFLISLFPPISL